MKTLTQENYYQNQDYMSNSMLNQYLKCPAKARALQRGDWVFAQTPAMKLGTLVHTYFEDKDMFKSLINTKPYLRRDGCLLKVYNNAFNMIEVLEQDPFCKYYLGLESEAIIQGTIEDIPFKGKVDHMGDYFFVELKTTWRIDPNNIERYYLQQISIYNELMKQNFLNSVKEAVLIIVTSAKVPQHELFHLSQELLSDHFQEAKKKIKTIKDYWSTATNYLPWCGKCDFCTAKFSCERNNPLKVIL